MSVGKTDFVALAATTHEYIQASLAEMHATIQAYSMKHPPKVYIDGDSAKLPCKRRFDGPTELDRNYSVAYTNLIMQRIQEDFVGPLSSIPNLHERVQPKVLDADTVARVNQALQRINSLAPPADESKIDFTTRAEREEFWRRCVNLLYSQHGTLVMDVAIFLSKTQSITIQEAVNRLINRRKASVADTIAIQTLNMMDELLRKRRENSQIETLMNKL